MAISGRAVMEDTTVEWADYMPGQGVDIPAGCLFVSVEDTLTGKRDSAVIDGRMFMQALAIALSWDGDIPGSEAEKAEWWQGAETTVAIFPADLRFIP